ncbi:MAG: NifU family protein [Bacilli bacterium]|nr:NifU family protein [Bacilli bacterium]MBP3635618.1 NifU family protein [Bacilli bacterium]
MDNDKKVTNKINEVIEKIRPFLINDGGDIELIKFENGIAYVRMLGNCSNCLYSGITIQETIETILTSEIPEVIEVKEFIEGISS